MADDSLRPGPGLAHLEPDRLDVPVRILGPLQRLRPEPLGGGSDPWRGQPPPLFELAQVLVEGEAEPRWIAVERLKSLAGGRRAYRCGRCGRRGHRVTTCPQRRGGDDG